MKSSKFKETEIINFLQNCPKGQLRYETGWDQNPQAIWQLVSSVQAEADETKLAVVERAIRISKATEQRRTVNLEGVISPLGTSSGSGSRITLENDSVDNGNSSSYSAEGFKSPKPRRKGYGIREDEYDDEAMSREFELQRTTETHNHINFLIDECERFRIALADEKSQKLREAAEKDLDERLAKVNLEAQKQLRKNQIIQAKSPGPSPEQEAHILAKVEAARVLRKKEYDAIDRSCEIAQKEKAEVKKAAKIAHENAAELERVNAVKVAEEQQRIASLQKVAEEEERKRQESEEARKQKEQNEAVLKLEAQRLLEQSKKEPSLPAALQGLILKEDCDRYTNCDNLIQQYETATQDIVAGSTNPNIKKFYRGASKCINTPLNAIANTEPGQIVQKINHFTQMIQGKAVIGSTSMTEKFSCTSLPNGKPFVIRLLAFRFVKKAELEILSEKKGFLPLATIGINLCKQFPEFASLVQSYFYKLCPFLIPFSFPRGDKTVQQYCQSLGYDLKGEDSTLLNELLGRIKGYCTLYAFMVQVFEKDGQFDIGEATSFFTIGGVWEVLTKTMRLEPQADITVLIIQTLLELMSDRLQQVYGKQYQKLMHLLISGYLPKINQVSGGASQSGVVRFQTFLEQKFRRPGFR